jgi:predicted AAA+ superfamily ATPase
MILKRAYDLNKLIEPGQVLIIYGPRRVGKTTLIKTLLENIKDESLFDNGDNKVLQELLSSQDQERILNHVSKLKYYALDEAQNVPNIGAALKIIVDNRPDLHVIVSGSSSFDLANMIGEPLVGRQKVLRLYPFSVKELAENFPPHKITTELDNILRYGLYPQVYLKENTFDKESLLQLLIENYLLKDIFALENIKSPSALWHLLKLLAQYIGSPISVDILAGEVGINKKTVERYLDLLEKTFVIKRINPYSSKLSQTLKFKPKYYFYDIGIRNALIGNFLVPRERTDIGALWENFVYMERIKKITYDREKVVNFFFFQSYQSQKEIDIIEEHNGINCLECKWTFPDDIINFPEWKKEYPNSPIKVVTKDNFFDYLI